MKLPTIDSVDAVVFDLDGVLLESEQVWLAAKRELAASCGGAWKPDADRDMLGMSSTEWSAYMHEQLGVELPPSEISREVAALVGARYRGELPLIPGAQAAVARVAERWPLALASSSNRETIDLVLELGGWQGCFSVTVSSEEVARGKPAPDVYLGAVRRLGAASELCVAVEDSDAGIRSALAAGLHVVAIPNRAFPPARESLRRAQLVLRSIGELDRAAIHSAASASASTR